jgi:5'(3')-deoxyribonucleotidase/2'-5' RNA ligase
MKNQALFEELYRIKKLAGLLNESESKIEAGVGLLLKLDNTTKNQIKSIISKMPSEPNGNNMTKLPDDKLHITLTSIKAFKPFKDKFKNLDDTKIPNLVNVKLGDAAFVYRDDGKVTYVVAIKNQSEIKDFVNELYKIVGEINPEPNRFFHITLCNNQGGDPFKSIGNVEKSDLIKEDTNTPLQFFFDLDGVLADMEQGLQQNSKIVSLRKRLDDLIKNDYPQYKNLVDDKIKEKLKKELPPDAPKDHPLRPLKRAFNDYRNSVFGVAAKEGFYKNLPLMPGTKEMLKAAQKISGKKPHILSSPVQGDNTSVQEKIDWVQTNFKGLVNKIIIDTNKGKYAKSKSDVLIDDRPKYVTEFESAGGSAILHKNYNTTIKEMEKFKQNEQLNRTQMLAGIIK